MPSPFNNSHRSPKGICLGVPGVRWIGQGEGALKQSHGHGMAPPEGPEPNPGHGPSGLRSGRPAPAAAIEAQGLGRSTCWGGGHGGGCTGHVLLWPTSRPFGGTLTPFRSPQTPCEGDNRGPSQCTVHGCWSGGLRCRALVLRGRGCIRTAVHRRRGGGVPRPGPPPPPPAPRPK